MTQEAETQVPLLLQLIRFERTPTKRMIVHRSVELLEDSIIELEKLGFEIVVVDFELP